MSKIVDYFKNEWVKRRSKHQVHVRKNTGYGRKAVARGARAVVNPAGSKLLKYFAKASLRGPRGY